jgi:hypothetical protein
VISALATFVTLVGTRFWAIVAFTLHQLRASKEDKDGIHHQRELPAQLFGFGIFHSLVATRIAAIFSD